MRGARELNGLSFLASHPPRVKRGPAPAPPRSISVLPRLRWFTVTELPPCIYFLCDGDRLLYVGQTVALESRARTQREQKPHRDLFYMPVRREDLNAVESALIRLFRPPLNGPPSTSDTSRDEEVLDALFGDLIDPLTMHGWVEALR